MQTKPTKKSSFLSLRREKKAQENPSSSPSPTSASSGRVRSGSHSASPSSFHPLDFEVISRPQISRPAQLSSSSRPKSSPKSMGSPRDEQPLKRTSTRSGKGRRDDRPGQSVAAEEHIDFPVVGDEIPWPEAEDCTLTPWSRRRVQTGPSGRNTDHVPFLNRPLKYPFRDSGSSSLSQFDPPPQTPVDDISFRETMFSIPVMVAAPVAGVETMDALVDGMNGYSGDDPYSELGFHSRSKISKSGYHPLFHPPLPTPPPGVTLGGALPRKTSVRRHGSSSDDESELRHSRRRSNRQKNHRPGSSRTASNATVTKSSIRPQSAREDIPYGGSSPEEDYVKPVYAPVHPKVVPPSISEIIRTHAPPSQRLRSKPSLSSANSCTHSSGGHSTNRHSLDLELPDPLPTDEENDIAARSSVDTIAEEVRTTIRNQARSSVISSLPLRLPSSAPHVSPSLAHESLKSFPSPKSDGRRNSSLYSYSTVSDQLPLPPLDLSNLTKAPINSPSQTIAQYLRSSRLTTLLRLTRFPYSCREAPLTVSLSDLGSPTGAPLIVFLGLGCVRHLMGLYDEMAECLGIRLITIDRWGLGRTDTPRSKSARGIPEWASVVEEVLDRLNIDQCSVMAHSAGAPYALAFANKFPERIRGDVCLLAPWVGGGEGGGYKWLKYVPNGILKTAQAAEWKVQAWMLGKPPTIAYEGIGFDVKNSPLPSYTPLLSPSRSPSTPTHDGTRHFPVAESEPRRSTSSGFFSDYDDLRDFDGRFESRSTLGRRSSGSQRSRTLSDAKRPTQPPTLRKPSRGFLGRLKEGITSHNNSQSDERHPTNGSGKKLKALRSMGSLKGRSSTSNNSTTKRVVGHTPSLPLPQKHSPEVGLGFDGLDWDKTIRPKSLPSHQDNSLNLDGASSVDISPESHLSPRSKGRRSISFGPTRSPVPPVPPLPSPLLHTPDPGTSNQAALGNALIAASHAESSRGTHGDLLQILNHDRQPWGFSYAAYPHNVRVWYGDRDERIAENVVRWMENTMGPHKCQVKVVKGADHALMFKSAVVVEVMEYFGECWQADR